MKKKQSDAVVGVVIFVAFIVLLGGVIWLKKISLTRTMATYTALFPKIGGLKVGDPVRVNGVEKGSVAQIYLKDAQVAVRFKIDQAIPFTDSSRITVTNVGLMGERAIEVTLSRAGSLHKPDSGKVPSDFIKGGYDSGISEAIGMLGNIMGEAKGLLDTVEFVVTSTVGDPEFIQFFGDAVERLDSITLGMDRIVLTNEKKINYIVSDLKSVTGNINRVVRNNSASFSTIVSNTEDLTGDAKVIVAEVDSLLVSLQSVVAKVDTGDGTIGRLINDDDLSKEVDLVLAKLNDLIEEADKYGLKLRIKLGHKEKKKKSKEATE